MQVTKTVICTVCKSKLLTITEPASFLILIEKPERTKGTDLESALDAFAQGTRYKDYQCSRCQKKVMAQLTALISSPPDVLRLQTFKGSYDNVTQTVQTTSIPYTAPLSLDLSPWCDPTIAHSTTTYILKAIVCGSPRHYTALVAYPTGWYFCNDRTVASVVDSVEEIITKKGSYQQSYNPVIFFYERSPSSYRKIGALTDLSTQLSTIAAVKSP